MKKASPGFAVLFVLLITSGLVLATLSLWHKVSLFASVMCEHEIYQKNLSMTEAVLTASLTLIKNNSDFFFSQKIQACMPLEFEVQAQFLGPLKAWLLITPIAQQKNASMLYVRVQLVKENKKIMAFSCCISRYQQRVGWEQNEKTFLQTLFVDYVTLSSAF
ncbi:MAG: hypothetical protein V1855_01115 [bacterium]